MQRRYLPISILTGIFFIAALIGYLIPANSESPPARVLLENKGGKVILTHAKHSELQGQDCVRCHHTSDDSQTPPECSTCHAKKFDEVFVADHQDSMNDELCISCHHQQSTTEKFSHEDHAVDYAEDDCQVCHHDTDIEPEPQACSDCHESKGTAELISLKKANHTKCADCHDDFYEEGIKGCDNCHTRKTTPAPAPAPQACSDCHSEPVDLLIPTSTNAFHGQCMSCHEEQGKGPFGDDACYQCHMK